jgi:hypothetical protein
MSILGDTVNLVDDDDDVGSDVTHLGVTRFTLPEELQQLELDLGMWDSIQHYVFLGLHPGSYGEALLLGDYELAIQRASPLHEIWRRQGVDVAENFIRIIQWLPDVCHTDPQRIRDWQHRGGLQCQPRMRVLFKLAI